MNAAADSDLVLQKADALMRRHRVFVAGSTTEAAPADVQEPTQVIAAEVVTTVDSVIDDEDIPLLTEVVLDEGTQFTQTDALEAQRHALAQALEIWLDEALPQAVLKVMDGVTDQLIATLSTQARNELLTRLSQDPNK